MAQLLLQQGKVDGALQYFEQAARLARTEAEIVNALSYAEATRTQLQVCILAFISSYLWSLTLHRSKRNTLSLPANFKEWPAWVLDKILIIVGCSLNCECPILLDFAVESCLSCYKKAYFVGELGVVLMEGLNSVHNCYVLYMVLFLVLRCVHG